LFLRVDGDNLFFVKTIARSCFGAVVVVVAIAISVIVSPAGAAPAWAPPSVAVSGIGFDSGGLFAWGDGEAAVLWHTSSPRAFPFLTEMVSYRRAVAAPWVSTKLVERESTYEGVAGNEAGEIVRAWWGADSMLEVWTKPAGSVEWYRQSIPVSTPPDFKRFGDPPYDRPEVAVGPSGDVAIVWGLAVSCPARCLYRLHAIVRAAGSSTWSPEVEIAPDTQRSGFTARAAVDRAGDVVVVWAFLPIPGPHVLRAAVRTAGGPWQPPVEIAGGEAGSSVGEPSLAMDANGDSVVAWAACCVQSTHGVFASYRGVAGSWSRPAIVTSETDATPRALIDRSGKALVSWVGRTATRSSVYTPGSRRWTEPALIAPEGWEDTPSDRADAIAMDPSGNAVAVFSTGSTLRTVLKPAASTLWSVPITVASNYERAVDLAFDGKGHAIAAWNAPHADGDAADLYSSNLAGGGPVLTSFTVPRRARAGQRVRVSVAAYPWDSPLVARPRWAFGDGSATRGASVTHIYKQRGSFTVTVRVLDAAGGATATSARIRVSRR
jgi:PKD domain